MRAALVGPLSRRSITRSLTTRKAQTVPGAKVFACKWYQKARSLVPITSSPLRHKPWSRPVQGCPVIAAAASRHRLVPRREPLARDRPTKPQHHRRSTCPPPHTDPVHAASAPRLPDDRREPSRGSVAAMPPDPERFASRREEKGALERHGRAACKSPLPTPR